MSKKIAWDSWSKNDEARYSMLYSYVKDKLKNNDDFTFIEDNKRNLMSLIEKNNNWSDASKEALLFTVAKYLKLSNYIKYGKMYSQKGYEYMMKNRARETENKQDENEIENYRTHEFLLNVINNIKPDNIASKTKHLQYL